MTNGKVILSILVIVLVSSMTFITYDNRAAKAATIYVNKDGTATYILIQDAIDHASEGDTVIVFYGYYTENLVINKSIHLIGKNKANTTLDGKQETVITIQANTVEITGMTIRNGSQGIKLVNSSNSSIRNNTYRDNDVGLYFDNESINNTIFLNNFINNTEHVDSASSNVWNTSSFGNFWDTYTGIDSDNDTIGNTPYIISDEINIDWYPMMLPITQTPIADFTYDPAYPSTKDTVTFMDTSRDDEGIISWQWEFGDGNISSLQNPTHTYPDNGVYQVALTVTDSVGAPNTHAINISIRNVPPTAEWAFSPLNPTDIEDVSFQDTSTDDDGELVNWSWVVSQNTTLYGKNISYQFPDNGSFPVILTVTDDDGATSILTKTITVSNVKPIVGFSSYGDNATLQIGDTVRFGDNSFDQDGNITKWNWSFGDGTTSTEKHPTHVYEKSGTYTVQLTVTDNDGASNSHVTSLPIVAPGKKDWMSRFSLSDIIFLVFLAGMIIFVFYVSRRYKS